MISMRSIPARLGRLGLVVGLLGGLAAGAGAAPTALRWKFTPGETVRYESMQTTQTKVKEAGGQNLDNTLTLTMDLTWKVGAVDPRGVATIVQTIDRIRTTATVPNGKLSFDSKESGDAAGPAGPLFKMLVGAEFTFKIDPQGELSDIKLADKLLATLKGDDQPLGAQGQFSEAGLKNMLVQMGVVLPAKEINPGDTWSRKLAIPAGINGETREVEQVYTLAAPAGGDRPLEPVDMATKFGPPPVDPNVPITVNKQEATGRFQFDNAAGRIDTSRVVERVDLTVKIQDKEINQVAETITVMTLRRDKNP